MREWASRRDVDGAAKLFVSNFKTLKTTLRIIRKQFGSLPASCSLEIQHMAMHIAALSLPDMSKDLAEQHFFAAIGHSRRALLDAYKEFIFTWKCNIGLSSDQQRLLTECRVKEIDENFRDGFTEIAARYKKLFDGILNISSGGHRIISSARLEFPQGYWPLTRQWLEIDSLISSLTINCAKNTAFLQRFIESLFFDLPDIPLPPKQFLEQTIVVQKFYVFNLSAQDNKVWQAINIFMRQKNKFPLLTQAVNLYQTLKTTKNRKTSDFQKFNNLIFPSLAEYFQLRYNS